MLHLLTSLALLFALAPLGCSSSGATIAKPKTPSTSSDSSKDKTSTDGSSSDEPEVEEPVLLNLYVAFCSDDTETSFTADGDALEAGVAACVIKDADDKIVPAQDVTASLETKSGTRAATPVDKKAATSPWHFGFVADLALLDELQRIELSFTIDGKAKTAATELTNFDWRADPAFKELAVKDPSGALEGAIVDQAPAPPPDGVEPKKIAFASYMSTSYWLSIESDISGGTPSATNTSSYNKSFVNVDVANNLVVLGAKDDPKVKALVDAGLCALRFSAASRGRATEAYSARAHYDASLVFASHCSAGDTGACGVISTEQSAYNTAIVRHKARLPMDACVVPLASATSELRAGCLAAETTTQKVTTGASFSYMSSYLHKLKDLSLWNGACSRGNAEACATAKVAADELKIFQAGWLRNEYGPTSTFLCYLTAVPK